MIESILKKSLLKVNTKDNKNQAQEGSYKNLLSSCLYEVTVLLCNV